MRRIVIAFTIAVASLAPSAASAQPTQADAATEAMFQRAVDAMAQKKFAEACPLLAEVVQRRPTGVGAIAELASCYEGEGKLASAWTTLVLLENVARKAGKTAREEEGRNRAAALKPRLSTLTIEVPKPVASLPGLAVKSDGVSIGPGQWGVPVPVDGGEHRIEAQATGTSTWSKSVTVPAESGRVAVTVEAPPASDAAAGTAPADSAAPDRGNEGGVPTWAWVSGAAGVVFVGVGIGFLISAASVHGDYDDFCPENASGRNVCVASPTEGRWVEQQGKDAVSTIKLHNGIGIAGCVVGGAAIGVAIYGVVTAPNGKVVSSSFAPWVLPGSAGASWGTRF